MEQPRIFLSPPCMSGRELDFVKEAFASNYIAPLGPMVDRIEKALCDEASRKHCAALSSGTAALHLALIILGVKPGDEVICPSFTFAASANPIVYVGARPVFVDSEPDTWNMCPALLDEAIQDRIARGKKPKAIILVHLYGMPAKLDEIMAIAEQYDIPVIEDAAEALGSCYASTFHRSSQSTQSSYSETSRSSRPSVNNLVPIGSFGVMSIFSFNGNKIITTSGGGALLSDNKDFIEQARFLATQARDPAPHYEHSQIGYNYRMSNIVAAIGCGQMEVLPSFVTRCREINAEYRKRLADLPGISFLTEPNSRFQSNYWLTTITVAPQRFGADRETIRLALEADNIESRPVWKPMHLQPVYRAMDVEMYGGRVCEGIFETGLCLPSGVGMTEGDIDRICGIITQQQKGSSS
jgi:dTDP-4-amino-4,6-dideoxygalactose transaminase